MGDITVSLLGSTGSIGTQAVDVVGSVDGRFTVTALAAGRSIDRLVAQAQALRPQLVVVADPSLQGALAARVPAGTEVMAGPEGLAAAAAAAEVVLNGVVGFAGLPATVAALEAGRRLALANKESLIAAAPVVQRARRTPGAVIVPVDSEHCAIHQCLGALASSTGPSGRGWSGISPSGSGAHGGGAADGPPDPPEELRRLLLTASGGPFRGRGRRELAGVTVADALSHPTWQMGPKITVDSSTLMNKGLEVIEAHELFGVAYERIEVVVHPQSVVHSMVELRDGATIAQLSEPDMRLAIGYALGWPDRLAHAFGVLDWTRPRTLDFEPPDRQVFACLELAYRAGRHGGAAPAWLSAANEVAVAAFLKGGIGWLDIAAVVSATLDALVDDPLDSLGAVLDADATARRCAETAVGRCRRAA